MSFGLRRILLTTKNFSRISSSQTQIQTQTTRLSIPITQQQRTFDRTFQKRGFASTVARMGVHNIANKAEFTAALKEHKLVVLDAFATWCGPCKVVAPHVVKFSEDFPGVHFVKIDVDDVPDVAQELGIRAMPTFIIFKGEEKVAEVVGANPKGLQVAIQKIVDEEKAAGGESAA